MLDGLPRRHVAVAYGDVTLYAGFGHEPIYSSGTETGLVVDIVDLDVAGPLEDAVDGRQDGVRVARRGVDLDAGRSLDRIHRLQVAQQGRHVARLQGYLRTIWRPLDSLGVHVADELQILLV